MGYFTPRPYEAEIDGLMAVQQQVDGQAGPRFLFQCVAVSSLCLFH